MSKGRSRLRFFLPLIVFALMALVLAVGLTLDPRHIPSPLLDRPAPSFSLPILHQPEKHLALKDMQGEPWVLNVWASWCVACLTEHPVLNEYAQKDAFNLVGLNYKDDPENGKKWLEERGNPYDVSIVDSDGLTGIDWGVYGVPETFVIDAEGIVRYKHIGPVTAEDIEKHILPWFSD